MDDLRMKAGEDEHPSGSQISEKNRAKCAKKAKFSHNHEENQDNQE